MELRARFDEANNIAWSKMLEEAGCKVIYGMENFKCHSKLCLITLQDKKGTHYITQVGTGNYNEKTSALYTDLSVMTASPSIGADGAAFFRNMLTDNLEGSYQTLWVAPYGLKPRILALIDEQIAKGPEGWRSPAPSLTRPSRTSCAIFWTCNCRTTPRHPSYSPVGRTCARRSTDPASTARRS